METFWRQALFSIIREDFVKGYFLFANASGVGDTFQNFASHVTKWYFILFIDYADVVLTVEKSKW